MEIINMGKCYTHGAISGAAIEDSLYYCLGITYNNRDGQIDNVENEDVNIVYHIGT